MIDIGWPAARWAAQHLSKLVWSNDAPEVSNWSASAAPASTPAAASSRRATRRPSKVRSERIVHRDQRPRAVPLQVSFFDVEEEPSCNYDYLIVSGNRYCGTSGAGGVVPNDGQITWHSDEYNCT
eukprot:5737927-Prymnesium_polylepis.1